MFARAQARLVEIDSEVLDPDLKSSLAREFEEKLASAVVGQDRAVRAISNAYQVFLAGLNQPGRPIGTLLLLGPTGLFEELSPPLQAELVTHAVEMQSTAKNFEDIRKLLFRQNEPKSAIRVLIAARVLAEVTE